MYLAMALAVSRRAARLSHLEHHFIARRAAVRREMALGRVAGLWVTGHRACVRAVVLNTGIGAVRFVL